MQAPPPLAYGSRTITDYLPASILADGRLLPLRPPENLPELPDVEAALVHALEVSSTPDLGPSLGARLASYRGGDVAVIVDDYTRPCAHQRRLLPPTLAWLRSHGVSKERLAIVIAGATHRDPKPEEYPFMLGEAVWREYEGQVFMHHDREDLERLGTMPDGTPVEINGRAARAEVLLTLSDLDYHYFAGVSGGPKHLVPGIAGRALTTADHLRMFGELGFAANVDMGILDGNPVFEYKRHAVSTILKGLRDRGHFAYAVICVLNPRHEIVALEGGDVLAVHRRLRPTLDRVYVMETPQLADVAIVAARHLGINVYQAGKAINAAARTVRPGGTVLCVAACPDGFGNEEFRGLMAIPAPILREAEEAIRAGGEASAVGAAAIDGALRAVQEVVMRDFKIGKQKPVDLLVQYRRTGWGNLWLLCEGLSDEERRLLPFRYVGERGGDPGARLRAWIEAREREGRPTYVVIDDPTYWVKARA
jgi:nickel-dependent lactate racemase